MSDHYAQLGVDRNATEQEIKESYRRLALIHHPDRATGNTERFKLLQEAYDILSDPDKRRSYDVSVCSNFDGFIDRYKKQGLSYYLEDDPNQYDYYTYLNRLFRLGGDKRFTVGQDIVNYDELWEKLNYIMHVLEKRTTQLRHHYPNPTKAIQAQFNKILLNSQKMGAISQVFGTLHAKQLYDLAIGVEPSDEMREIERLIGGKAGLIRYITDAPEIYIADGVFLLYETHCLTPDNFNHLVQFKSSRALLLKDLLSSQILTHTNFERLVENKKHIVAIGRGISSLKLAGMLNQHFFDLVVNMGKNAGSVGANMRILKRLGILNDENLRIVVKKIPGSYILVPLGAMGREGLLTLQQSEVLMWTGSPELSRLNSCIDQMVAHGLFLLSCDVEKGKAAMLLGLALKQDVKEYFEKSQEEQAVMKEQFKASFMAKLHSRDHEMSVHRALWKVIIANIIVALSGVGLFALGVNYLVHGRCFFAQTRRQQQIESVEKEIGLTPL